MTGRAAPKPATAARMYDYYLGGIHNFPADRAAAREVLSRYPWLPAAVRANRAFLGRAVRHIAEAGVRQFLDLGSGVPTVRNVHEVAQEVAAESRVVYVDIDPVAVVESLDMLAGNDLATAIRGDVRNVREIVEHQGVRRMLDFTQPVGIVLAAVLHFVVDDELAHQVVRELVGTVPSGSYLVMSHAARESFVKRATNDDVYEEKTSTPGTARTRSEVEQFFCGLKLLDPGVVWIQHWRPEHPDSREPLDAVYGGGGWAGVGLKP